MLEKKPVEFFEKCFINKNVLNYQIYYVTYISSDVFYGGNECEPQFS